MKLITTIAFILLFSTSLFGLPPHAFATSITISNPYVTKSNSYKGQLHNHTTNSDGSSSPWDVVTAYKNAGYNFISITDHNLITPDPGVNGIFFIPGAEQSCIGGHIGRIKAKSLETNISIPAQTLINKINAEGGIAILNHPYYPKPNGTWTPARIDALSGYAGIEIFNSLLLNDGTAYAEDRWDYVLSQNKMVWGFATDDCHNQNSSKCRTAYIRVFANNLTFDEIFNNIKSGNFYSGYTPHGSTDIRITISVADNTITTTTNVPATIEFITSGGQVKKTVKNSTSSSYTPIVADKYVRIRVTKGGAQVWSNPLQINPPPGDLDRDGDVDIDDYNTLISDFGKTGTAGWIPADIDKNGRVDIFDYNILVGNFGK